MKKSTIPVLKTLLILEIKFKEWMLQSKQTEKLSTWLISIGSNSYQSGAIRWIQLNKVNRLTHLPTNVTSSSNFHRTFSFNGIRSDYINSRYFILGVPSRDPACDDRSTWHSRLGILTESTEPTAGQNTPSLTFQTWSAIERRQWRKTTQWNRGHVCRL